MIKKIIRILLFVGVIGIFLFVIIQLIPYGRNHNNPPVVSEPNWDSPQTRALAKRACFDCHSNETVWPTYGNIAPGSWLIYRDVIDGRRKFNFSDWQKSPIKDINKVTEVIQKGGMPPLQYLLLHPSAKLSEAEKQQLIAGLNNTISR
jgi:hypothetical protein